MRDLAGGTDLYDEIRAHPAWRDTQEALRAGPFVDLNRLLVPAAPG